MDLDLAHTVGGPGGAEIEMLSFGTGLLLLAFLFRPSQVGGRLAPLLVTLGGGVALIAGSFVIPRL